MARGWWMLGAMLVTAVACGKGDEQVDKDKSKDKGGEAGAKCKKDDECGDGLLCEAKTCVPESVAKKARAASSGTASADTKTAAPPPPADPAPAPAPTAAEPAPLPPPACGPPKEVPEIPSEKSNPPTTEEWANGCDINTQGPNSEATDCTMRILREWLQVTCHGDIVRYEEMDGFGKEGQDYFKQVSGSAAAFVVRLVKNRNPKVRICRAKDRASLFVSWPPGKDKPTIIALGRGAKCD